MSTLPIAPECFAAASLIERGGYSGPQIAKIIQDHLSMVLLESREYHIAVQELMWMHDDKTLGLKPGDRFTIEGIRALRKQRDALAEWRGNGEKLAAGSAPARGEINCVMLVGGPEALNRANEIEAAGGTVLNIGWRGENWFQVWYRTAAPIEPVKDTTPFASDEGHRAALNEMLYGIKPCACGQSPKPVTLRVLPGHPSCSYMACPCGRNSPLYDTPARALEMWNAGHRETT